MIVLIPVSRFRLVYEVTEGVPYSQLERLVLRAVGEGITSKEELVKTFQIHPRLLIESLMTLTHTGWVALGDSHEKQFVLTPEGHTALKKDEIPESIVVRSRRAFVLLERITGTVIPEGEVRYVAKKVLKDKSLWNNCIRLHAEVLDNKLDESQVQHLLPRQQGQRLHWVGPIDMVSKGADYIPVSVDIEHESTVNLPQRCEIYLKPYVIEAVKEEISQKEHSSILTWGDLTQKVKVKNNWVSVAAESSRLPSRSWTVPWAHNDLLYTEDQHRELLSNALKQAQTSVLITSKVAEKQRLEQLKPDMVNALKRGVDINLLWGYENERENLGWMKKLAYDVKQGGAEGKLRFNRTAAFCNAKIVLWDEGEGFVGAVGSYDWLSETPNENSKDLVWLSLRVTHPAILSALSWCAAGLWAGSHSENLSSVPDRWRRIATNLESQVSDIHDKGAMETPNQAKIMVLIDREHLTLMREWTATSQGRLLVSSADLDTAAEKRLNPAAIHDHHLDFTCQVIYGHSELDEESIKPIRETVERARGALRYSSQIKANVIISDQLACLSSFNFLSRQFQDEAREIGLVIEGIDPINQIADRLLNLVY
jgi:hypothetical protein